MFPITMLQTKAREAGLEFLLIGGHAVNLYAEPRATLDVDLLIRNAQAAPWRAILAGEGFTAHHDGGNFLQFRPPYGTSWRLDLMLVNDETFAKLLAASKPVECFGVPIRIPSAEHMIALKLHAMVHGPADRFEKDFVDVVGIARNTGILLASRKSFTALERLKSMKGSNPGFNPNEEDSRLRQASSPYALELPVNRDMPGTPRASESGAGEVAGHGRPVVELSVEQLGVVSGRCRASALVDPGGPGAGRARNRGRHGGGAGGVRASDGGAAAAGGGRG